MDIKRPRQKLDDRKILLAHGSGGRLSRELVSGVFRKIFSNRYLDELDDSAVLDNIFTAGDRICFTTDSYVIEPIFFPGGDIGKLAVCGTINDLSVMGAVPVYISCGFIVEEGFPVNLLEKIAKSMQRAADEAKVKIVTGDTKVVPKGYCGGVYINTAGIGVIRKKLILAVDRIRAGDMILVNGSIGDHGFAVISAREKFKFGGNIKSDCSALNDLIMKLVSAGLRIKFMRDPTRGGLATVLNEIVENREFSIMLEEKKINIREEVKTLADLLGLDPLYMANEGKVVIVIDCRDAGKALGLMKRHSLGRSGSLIGEVVRRPEGKVFIKTASGGMRIADMLVGDQLPRIC